jgi:hypothetical protein
MIKRMAEVSRLEVYELRHMFILDSVDTRPIEQIVERHQQPISTTSIQEIVANALKAQAGL